MWFWLLHLAKVQAEREKLVQTAERESMALISSSLLKWIPVPFILGGLAALGALARHVFESPCTAPAGPALSLAAKAAFDPKALFPVTIVTIASVALYYVFLFSQAGCSLLAHEMVAAKAKKDGPEPTIASVKFGACAFPFVRCFDRAVGNFLEQWPAFLIAIWLYALFVDAKHAGALGWLWIATRSYYPAAHYAAFQTDVFPILFASTLPGYLTILYMLGQATAAIMH